MDRIVDLATPFQDFYYCNLSQKGSYSLKKVLPAITRKGYGGLHIAREDLAAVRYVDVTFHNSKEKVYKDLLKYCELDTEGMVWILEKLRGFVE